MRIGILSDTHSPSTGQAPPPQVATAFRDVDLILHAGDIYTSGCLDWLEKIAPVLAVDHVGTSYFDADDRVEEKRVISVEGFTIGLMHEFMLPGLQGEPLPGAIGEGFPSERSIVESLRQVFDADLDIMVFGHTHYAMIEEHQGVLFVNPGSPSLPRHIRRLGEVAILDVTPGRREATIIRLADLEPTHLD